MFAIPSILMMCAASLVAPKNGEEQRWNVNLSNSRITDTLKLSFKEDSASHFTVSESLVGEPNYHVQSQYVYRSDSGMTWNVMNLKCDSTKLTNPSICRTLNSIPTAALSFILLGNLPEGFESLGAAVSSQCSLPNNCKEHLVTTNETRNELTKEFDTSLVDGVRTFFSKYAWVDGGTMISCRPTIQASASFLGDSSCQSVSYIYYAMGVYWPKGAMEQQPIDTLLVAQRIDVQNAAAGIAASSQAIHTSTSLVFHDVHVFQTWKDAQGGASVSAIDVNGEKATVQHGARQMFVRSQGRVYRVLILGD